jgi:hypothetical protein
MARASAGGSGVNAAVSRAPSAQGRPLRDRWSYRLAAGAGPSPLSLNCFDGPWHSLPWQADRAPLWRPSHQVVRLQATGSCVRPAYAVELGAP